jgi:hypothetical protein
VSSNRRRAPRGWTTSPSPAYSHKLKHADVMARVKDHGPNHYSGLYNVMKGVSLAGAGFALVRLAGQGFPVGRVMLVLVALVGVFLTYYGQTVGLIIVSLRPSILDIALPMLLTVVELYIAYRPGMEHGDRLPADWFGGLAVWAALAASVIASVAWRLNCSGYVSNLWPIAEGYKAELWEDVKAASGLAVAAIIFVSFRCTIGIPVAVDYGFLAFVACVLGAGINSQGRTKAALARRLGIEI